MARLDTQDLDLTNEARTLWGAIALNPPPKQLGIYMLLAAVVWFKDRGPIYSIFFYAAITGALIIVLDTMLLWWPLRFGKPSKRFIETLRMRGDDVDRVWNIGGRERIVSTVPWSGHGLTSVQRHKDRIVLWSAARPAFVARAASFGSTQAFEDFVQHFEAVVPTTSDALMSGINGGFKTQLVESNYSKTIAPRVLAWCIWVAVLGGLFTLVLLARVIGLPAAALLALVPVVAAVWIPLWLAKSRYDSRTVLTQNYVSNAALRNGKVVRSSVWSLPYERLWRVYVDDESVRFYEKGMFEESHKVPRGCFETHEEEQRFLAYLRSLEVSVTVSSLSSDPVSA